MKRFILYTAITAASLAMFCSSDKPLPSGYDALQRQDKGEVLVYQAPLVQTARYWAPVVAGSAPYLLLGEDDGIQCRIALLFSTLTSIDTATVIQADLILDQIALFGSGTTFSGNIHPITATWSESTVKWSDIETNYDASKSYSYSVNAIESDSFITAIDPELVNGWVRGESNYGLLLDFDNADFAVKFLSSESSSSWAVLQVIYAPKAGGLDTLSIDVSQDATLFKESNTTEAYTREDEPGELTLGNGSGYRFLLRFDLSGLPADATIHRGLLSMTVHGASSAADSAGVTFSATPLVTDSLWQDLATAKLDSLYSSPVATATDDEGLMQISATPYVSYMGAIAQRWLLGTEVNYGLMVQSTQYGYDLEKLNFYGMADESHRPALQIIYSLPPSARF